MAKSQRGPGAAKVAPTAADLAQRFLAEHADVKRKASTAREYHPLLDHVIVPALGKERVADARDTADPMAASIDIWSKEHR